MNILKEYGICEDKKLRYNLVKGNGESLSNMVGQRIRNIKAYIVFEQPDSNGEIQKVLKVLVTGENDKTEILGTSSKSFVEGFIDYLDCMESDECAEFEIGQKRSTRSGRPYITFIA